MKTDIAMGIVKMTMVFILSTLFLCSLFSCHKSPERTFKENYEILSQTTEILNKHYDEIERSYNCFRKDTVVKLQRVRITKGDLTNCFAQLDSVYKKQLLNIFNEIPVEEITLKKDRIEYEVYYKSSQLSENIYSHTILYIKKGSTTNELQESEEYATRVLKLDNNWFYLEYEIPID